MTNVTEAVRMLGGGDLAAALWQLKSPDGSAGGWDYSSAKRLIETLSGLYLRQFQDRVERFQDSSDPAEAGRLWAGISRDLFGV